MGRHGVGPQVGTGTFSLRDQNKALDLARTYVSATSTDTKAICDHVKTLKNDG